MEQAVRKLRTGDYTSAHPYSPNTAAAFSLNSDPSFIYRRTIFSLRCPVWFMMLRSEAPAAAALEARPERKLCPAKWEASSPKASTDFFTMSRSEEHTS